MLLARARTTSGPPKDSHSLQVFGQSVIIRAYTACKTSFLVVHIVLLSISACFAPILAAGLTLMIWSAGARLETKADRFRTVFFLSFIYRHPDLWTSVSCQRSFEGVRTQFQLSRDEMATHTITGEVKNQPSVTRRSAYSHMDLRLSVMVAFSLFNLSETRDPLRVLCWGNK